MLLKKEISPGLMKSIGSSTDLTLCKEENLFNENMLKK